MPVAKWKADTNAAAVPLNMEWTGSMTPEPSKRGKRKSHPTSKTRVPQGRDRVGVAPAFFIACI